VVIQVINSTSIAKQSQVFVNLTNLSAFTGYEVTVDCIPLVDNRVAGFWSEKTSAQFTTKQDGLFFALYQTY